MLPETAKASARVGASLPDVASVAVLRVHNARAGTAGKPYGQFKPRSWRRAGARTGPSHSPPWYSRFGAHFFACSYRSHIRWNNTRNRPTLADIQRRCVSPLHFNTVSAHSNRWCIASAAATSAGIRWPAPPRSRSPCRGRGELPKCDKGWGGVDFALGVATLPSARRASGAGSDACSALVEVSFGSDYLAGALGPCE